MSASRQRGWVNPALLDFIKEGRRQKDYSLVDALHGFIYARWIYFYIQVGLGRHSLSGFLAAIFVFFEQLQVAVTSVRTGDRGKRPDPGRALADGYHGKVLPLAAARQMVTVREDIRVENLESVIPFARARDLVIMNPDHIVALDCPCRVARENPCLPLDVCLVVGEPFASLVTSYHPDRSRQITSDEAVAILKAEDERGHVHHAFFKDAMLGRFYAICNCCSCCCGAMHAHQNGVPMLASSGYVSQVDESLCLACGECEPACQFGALSVDLTAGVNAQVCMGCGVCVSKCSTGALSLKRDSSRGEPLEIECLLERAAA